MKNSKKMLSFIMAILVMMGSLGLVSTIADTSSGNQSGTTAKVKGLTGDPKYLLKFSNENVGTPKFLSNNEINLLNDEDQDITRDGLYVKSAAKSGQKLTLNSNNSITLIKESVTEGEDYQYATNLEIPVTDEMRTNYTKAEDNKLYISYYFSKIATTKTLYKGEFTDCQFRIYVKYKNAFDVTVGENIKKRKLALSSLGENNCFAYEQRLDQGFKLKGHDGNVLTSLDEIESIIFSIYNYNKDVEAELQLSSITYAGSPEVTPFEEPTPAPVDEYVSFTDWSNHYLLASYGDTPKPVTYSANGGYDSKAYSTLNKETKKGSTGWLYFKQSTPINSRQVNTNFTLNKDAVNKAIVSAKQPGADGKLKIKVFFPTIKDTEGKDMQAEFTVAFNRTVGGTYTPVQTYINPGKEYIFEMDVSELNVNQVSSVRVALMAFWNYDKTDDVYYDVDKAKRYDKDGNSLTAVYTEAGDFKGYYDGKSYTPLDKDAVDSKDADGKEYDKDGNLLTALYTRDEDHKNVFFGYDNGKNGTFLTSKDVVKVTANCSNGKKDVDITDIESKLYKRTMKDVVTFVSPIYAGTLKEVETTTATETEANTGDVPYEFEGEHFYDFTAQAYAETYGDHTHSSFVNYLYPDYYNSYEVIDYNIDKDNIKQGYKDRNNPAVRVEGDEKYKKDFQEATSLMSGGYQVELHSPYPRVQHQFQSYFHVSGADEDKRLTDPNCGDHKNQKPQGETYDFRQKMGEVLEHAKNHPDGNKRGYIAIDVYAVEAVHGYKNTYNSTYKAWCKKNNKPYVNENTSIQFQIGINASFEGSNISATVLDYVAAGSKRTFYLDVSEIDIENITGIQLAAQQYANLANREQGGDNSSCGMTDVRARFSAMYIPGSGNNDLVTTTTPKQVINKKEALKIKRLYDALPGLTVDDYETEADYEKLAAFIKAWSNANKPTQEYCEKEYDIDYSMIGMLEYDVYDKIYGSGWIDDDGGYDMGDIAFPMASLVVAGLAGYVLLRTRKKK